MKEALFQYQKNIQDHKYPSEKSGETLMGAPVRTTQPQ